MNAGYICSRVFLYLLPPRRGRGRRGRAGLNRGRGKRTAPPAAKLLNLNLPPEVVDPWSNAQAGVVLQQAAAAASVSCTAHRHLDDLQ